MTTAAQLPEPLKQVTIVPNVPPSMLAVGPVCTLRRQGRELDGSRIAGLIESPWAILGTLVHRSIQLADGRSNLRDVFDELVRRREVELLGDQRRSHLVPLRSAIGEGGWSSRLQLLDGRQGSRDPLPMGLLDAQANDMGRPPRPKHEVWLQSDALGLSGSVDHVEFVDDHLVRMTDWKTGPVFNAEGEVKEHFRLQLAAYRMLGQVHWPEREIETYLFNGEYVKVQVTRDDEEQVLQAVADSRAIIRGRNEALATELALLGDECAGCSIRHRCPAYLEVLRSNGRAASVGPAPAFGDVLGEVATVQKRDEVNIINLNLPTGSKVQVRLSSHRLGCSELQGEKVTAFGLMPLARRSRVNGEPLEPLMYEEVGQTRRAWQAEIFRL